MTLQLQSVENLIKVSLTSYVYEYDWDDIVFTCHSGAVSVF